MASRIADSVPMRFRIVCALLLAVFVLAALDARNWSMQFFILGALGLVAFVLASLAVQSWRELLALAVLSAMLFWPVKWIAAGTWFGADSLVYSSDGERWRLSFSASGALVTSIFLASIVMILARHVILTLRAKKGDEA